jgi:hypothetical protein
MAVLVQAGVKSIVLSTPGGASRIFVIHCSVLDLLARDFWTSLGWMHVSIFDVNTEIL